MAEPAAHASCAELLAALRACGAPERDPVRFRLAEALARRADAQAGAAREAIVARLRPLVASFETAAAPVAAPPPARPQAGALSALVAHAARQKPAPVLAPAAAPARPAGAGRAGAAAGREDRDEPTLQFFKSTWSRLSAAQRLAQSRATLPENAGPLNSQHLVHRSLTLMHALSPAYLERFVGYIDALQWLEQANDAALPVPARRAMAARR